MAIISEAPINPRYVYTQATEPLDKTEGKLWFNTTTNALYTSDGIDYNVIGAEVPKLLLLYTGSDFDLNDTSTSEWKTSPIELSHELTVIPAAKLTGLDYLKIKILGEIKITNGANSAGEYSIESKIQTKDVGGSYSDSKPYYYELERLKMDDDEQHFKTGSMVWVHTLTDEEKANGIQIKVFAKGQVGTVSRYSNLAYFRNKQLTVEGVISNI